MSILIDGLLVLVVLATVNSWAAKAPLSPERLEQEATNIVSGKVIKVTSKTEKSKVELAPGTHLDRVFQIKVKVTTVTKGKGINAGDDIEVVAWQAASRNPPLPGLQGHEPVPKEGDTVKFYLLAKSANAFEPVMPNGMVIQK